MFQGGSLWAGLITGGVSQYQDTRSLNDGGVDRTGYCLHTTENVSGALGVMAGVEYGAVLGTAVMPGVGTAVGAVIGGIFGDKIGRVVGQQAGGAIFNNRVVQNMMQTAKPNHNEAPAPAPEPVLH